MVITTNYRVNEAYDCGSIPQKNDVLLTLALWEIVIAITTLIAGAATKVGTAGAVTTGYVTSVRVDCTQGIALASCKHQPIMFQLLHSYMYAQYFNTIFEYFKEII